MISFRYHIVSIVAVLLAMALGLLVGATFLNKRLENTLRRQTSQLQLLASRLQDEKGQLDAFVNQVEPYLTSDRLAQVPVIIITQEGVDPNLVAGTRDALDRAGADTAAVLAVQPAVVSTDPAVRQQLAQAIGQPDAAPGKLPVVTARVLGERLANGRRKTPGGTDRLSALLGLDGGPAFVRSVGEPSVTNATVGNIGGDGAIVVVVAGGQGPPVIPTEEFLIPLVQSLLARGAQTAAGESVPSDYAFVPDVRTSVSGSEAGSLVTVDDLDLTIGEIALVLGLETLRSTGNGGNYGIASGVIVPPPPSPTATASPAA